MPHQANDRNGTEEPESTLALHRAGLSMYWSFDTHAFVVGSKYIERFFGKGESEEKCLAEYQRQIQEAYNWRQVAGEFLTGVEKFAKALDDPRFKTLTDFLSWLGDPQEVIYVLEQGLEGDLDGIDIYGSPMTFWNEVLIPLFEEAYESQDKETINRIHAFADWSMRQEESGAEAKGDLPTCALVCFYEFLPCNHAALQDMPNWFTFKEIESWLVNSPFMKTHQLQIKRVYGLI